MEPLARSLPGSVALRDAAELVTKALDLAPLGIAIANGGRVIAVNRRLGGWHQSPATPDGFVGVQAATADEPELTEALGAAERGEARELSLDRLSLLGGRAGAWHVHLLPFAAAGTRSVAIVIEDQTDEAHAAEAFAASEQRFRLLVDCANDGIAVHRDGVLLYANPAATAILGFDRVDDLIGRSVMEFVHPDHRAAVRERIANLARGVPAPLREEVFVKADGRAVVVEVSASRAPLGEGYATFVFFRDVTDRKQLEAEVERSRRMDSLGRLAGGIAHDFNNLMSTIHAALTLARAAAGNAAACAQALAQADEATARARDLTRQLLTFSRGGEAQSSAVDPNQTVRETADLLRLASDQVELGFDLAPDVGKVWIDPSQLHQVLMNLLLNARDAIDGKGSILVRTRRCRLELDPARPDARAGDWITLEVSDTGAGMTAETQTRIFEPFFTTKPSGEGTGLGLSTVYGVVRQAGGWVEVRSAEHSGTVFRVYLPALGVSSVPPESVARPQRSRALPRILICDDEVRLAALTAGLLEQHGFAADTASTGPSALALIEADPARFDALLLDVNLSGRSASELLADLTERGLEVPVVLSSGYAEEDVDPQLLGHPLVVGYLAKPYPVERLVELAERAVGSRAGD